MSDAQFEPRKSWIDFFKNGVACSAVQQYIVANSGMMLYRLGAIHSVSTVIKANAIGPF
jgi:hypothetical protein